MTRTIALLPVGILFLALAGCSEEPAAEDVYGVWQPDDGTSDKTIQSDGQCSGMYYNNGEPLDIGGPMQCTVGTISDDGDFTMVVEQPPNKRSYQAHLDGDTLELRDGAGVVVTLTRG